METPVAETEKEFIREGCRDGVRFDGRGCFDFRTVYVENNIFPHVNGSSRVKIADAIDILCSIKVEVLTCDIATTIDGIDQGVLEFNVDFSPSCSSRVKLDERKLSDYGSEVAQQLHSVYSGSTALFLDSLCIVPGRYFWAIYVDLLILKLDGDPLDACSIAALVALTCTKIPQTELSLGESGEPEDFELVGDLASANLLDVSKIPVIVTVNKVGSALVLDTAGCESACVSSSLSAAFDRDGNCCGLMKGRGGNISSIETIDAISIAKSFSASIFKQIDQFHQSSAAGEMGESGQLFPDQPPSRVGLLS